MLRSYRCHAGPKQSILCPLFGGLVKYDGLLLLRMLLDCIGILVGRCHGCCSTLSSALWCLYLYYTMVWCLRHKEMSTIGFTIITTTVKRMKNKSELFRDNAKRDLSMKRRLLRYVSSLRCTIEKTTVKTCSISVVHSKFIGAPDAPSLE